MCVSKPKISAPTAVVERQPYKNATPREALAGTGDAEARRRMIAGVATSARGIAEPASTTKRVRAGGDAPIMPLIGGAPAPLTGAASAPAPSPPPAAQPSTGASVAAARAKPRPAVGRGAMARNIAAVLAMRAA